jgi:polyisoprenoid-binding protein YceI
MKNIPFKSTGNFGRRDIFRAGGAAAATGLLSWFPASAAAAIGLSATATFKRSDFSLDKYIPTVGDEIELEVHAEFQRD